MHNYNYAELYKIVYNLVRNYKRSLREYVVYSIQSALISCKLKKNKIVKMKIQKRKTKNNRNKN